MRDPAFAAAATARFTPSEQARLARIVRNERRLQFIFGHWLARALLAACRGCPIEHIAIEVVSDGRPQPTACGTAFDSLRLSLSHSGPWVVALVATPAIGTHIGIDIEVDGQGDPDRANERATARAPHGATDLAVDWPRNRRPAPPRDPAVTAAWVLGEARAKAAPHDGPAWQASVRLDLPAVEPTTLHIAAANVEFSPRVRLVNVRAASYNPEPIDLHWKQAQT